MGVHDPYSLTPDLVLSVAGVLRRAGYRSAMSYVDQAYVTFKELGGSPSYAIERAITKAKIAINRGIGPAKQAAALPPDLVAELQDSPDPWSPGGPCFPRRSLICATWWLAREIESGNAVIHDVTFPAANEVRWNLPASKADPKVLGAARSHFSACGQAPGAPKTMDPSLLATLQPQEPAQMGLGTGQR